MTILLAGLLVMLLFSVGAVIATVWFHYLGLLTDWVSDKLEGK